MENRVRELEKQRFNCLINKQYEQFAALCNEDLRYVHTSGTVDDLPAFMKKLQAGYYDYQDIDYDIINVVNMHDCVIVIANFHANLLVDGQARTLQNRALSIWKKQQEQLKLMMYQATPFN